MIVNLMIGRNWWNFLPTLLEWTYSSPQNQVGGPNISFRSNQNSMLFSPPLKFFSSRSHFVLRYFT
jgi:hypothetical protein